MIVYAWRKCNLSGSRQRQSPVWKARAVKVEHDPMPRTTRTVEHQPLAQDGGRNEIGATLWYSRGNFVHVGCPALDSPPKGGMSSSAPANNRRTQRTVEAMRVDRLLVVFTIFTFILPRSDPGTASRRRRPTCSFRRDSNGPAWARRRWWTFPGHVSEVAFHWVSSDGRSLPDVQSVR